MRHQPRCGFQIDEMPRRCRALFVLFEGRDSAGKGGVIKRTTQRLNPRRRSKPAMPADSFRNLLVPVVVGLGVFMLGLAFMSSGIQSLVVNKKRALLAKYAGTLIKGHFAGTLIIGVPQSSTVMVVG